MAFPGTGWRRFLCVILVFLAAASAARAQGDLVGDDLDLIAPPDLSSPRATLNSLRTGVQRATDLLAKAWDQYRAEPGFFASPEVNEKLRVADLLFRRAVATLDLSQVLAVSREQTGIEVVLALEEIFDRLPAIDLETIPDAAAVAANELTAWTLPYTDLDDRQDAEGPSAGQFVFSSDTVVEARDSTIRSGSTASA